MEPPTQSALPLSAKPPANRVAWVDNAKALGIFLVVYGHVLECSVRLGQTEGLAQYRFIYAFHLPLFFFMAGFFWKRRAESLETETWRLIKARLIPAWFFGALLIPAWLLKAYAESGTLRLYEIKFKLFGYLRGLSGLNYVMWFVVCLFLAELFAYLLLPRLRSAFMKTVVTSVFLLGGLVICEHPAYVSGLVGIDHNTWYWQEALVAFGFYALGHVSFPLLGDFLKKSWPLRAIASVVLLVVCGFAASQNTQTTGGVVLMTNGDHGSILWFLLAAFTGVSGFLCLASLLPASRWLSATGAATLGILGFNGFFQDFINPVILRYWAFTENTVLTTLFWLALSIASIAVSMPVIAVLARRTPLLLGNASASVCWRDWPLWRVLGLTRRTSAKSPSLDNHVSR